MFDLDGSKHPAPSFKELAYVPRELLHDVHPYAQTDPPEVTQRPALQQLAIAERAPSTLLSQRDLDLLALGNYIWVVWRVPVLQLCQDAYTLFYAPMSHAPAWAIREDDNLQEETERKDCLEA